MFSYLTSLVYDSRKNAFLISGLPSAVSVKTRFICLTGVKPEQLSVGRRTCPCLHKHISVTFEHNHPSVSVLITTIQLMFKTKID